MYQGPTNKPIANHNEIAIIAISSFLFFYPTILWFGFQCLSWTGIANHSGWLLLKSYLSTFCPPGINGFVFGLGSAEDVSAWLYSRYPKSVPFVQYLSFGLSLVTSGWFGWDAGKPLGDELHISGPQYWLDTKKAKAAAQANEMMLVKDSGAGISIGGVTISRDRETKHQLVVGRTGGGKTVAIAPMIQQVIKRLSTNKEGLQAHDKLIIFDNKGDFTRWVTCADGSAPTILAPWDARSPAWDIARDCGTRAEAAELAARFIPDSGNDPMWASGARQILTGFMVKLQCELLDKWTWRDLADLLAVPLNDVSGIMEQYHPEGLRAVEQVEGAQKGKGGAASKTTQSLMITLSAQMSGVYRMAEAWENSTEKWSVSDFLTGHRIDEDGVITPLPQVVILQGNATYSEIQKSYIQGVIAMLAGRVNSPAYVECKPSEPGLWLFLDEVPQIGELPWLKPFLEIGRSKGMRCVLGMQDVSQMYEIYGKEAAEAILNIPQGFIFAGLGGESSPMWAANMIGKRRVARHRRSGTNKTDGTVDFTLNYNEEEDYCVRPNQFTSGLGRTIGGVRSIFWPGADDAFRLLFPFPSVKDVRPSMVPAAWTLPEWKKKLIAFEEQILAIAMAQTQTNAVKQVPAKDRFKTGINFVDKILLDTDSDGGLEDEEGDDLEDDDAGGDSDSGVERGPEKVSNDSVASGGAVTALAPTTSGGSKKPHVLVLGKTHKPNQENDLMKEPVEDSLEPITEPMKEMIIDEVEELSPVGGEMLGILSMLAHVVEIAESAKTKPAPVDNEYVASNE